MNLLSYDLIFALDNQNSIRLGTGNVAKYVKFGSISAETTPKYFLPAANPPPTINLGKCIFATYMILHFSLKLVNAECMHYTKIPIYIAQLKPTARYMKQDPKQVIKV